MISPVRPSGSQHHPFAPGNPHTGWPVQSVIGLPSVCRSRSTGCVRNSCTILADFGAPVQGETPAPSSPRLRSSLRAEARNRRRTIFYSPPSLDGAAADPFILSHNSRWGSSWDPRSPSAKSRCPKKMSKPEESKRRPASRVKEPGNEPEGPKATGKMKT